MIQLSAQMRILVAVASIDFRAGIDGLARICRAQLRVDPFCGWLVVFCNRRRTAIKILTYDGQGFWVCHKRLSQGRFPYWPTDGPLQELAAHQLQVLLMGADPHQARGAAAWRARPQQPLTVDCSALRVSLRELGPLTFVQVRRTPEEPTFNALLQAHHYLGYSQPVGEHLKFMVYAAHLPVALFAWSSAPRHLGPRDRFLGWSAAARRANIASIAYNTRYLILPWVRVEHLASHLLARMTGKLPGAWRQVYGHPVHFAETFIDPTRYRGTCYRAANWLYLGQTQGRGKDDLTHRANRSVKDVLGLPLCRDFRERLTRWA